MRNLQSGPKWTVLVCFVMFQFLIERLRSPTRTASNYDLTPKRAVRIQRGGNNECQPGYNWPNPMASEQIFFHNQWSMIDEIFAPKSFGFVPFYRVFFRAFPALYV
jgi:hypothetical protein